MEASNLLDPSFRTGLPEAAPPPLEEWRSHSRPSPSSSPSRPPPLCAFDTPHVTSLQVDSPIDAASAPYSPLHGDLSRRLTWELPLAFHAEPPSSAVGEGPQPPASPYQQSSIPGDDEQLPWLPLLPAASQAQAGDLSSHLGGMPAGTVIPHSTLLTSPLPTAPPAYPSVEHSLPPPPLPPPPLPLPPQQQQEATLAASPAVSSLPVAAPEFLASNCLQTVEEWKQRMWPYSRWWEEPIPAAAAETSFRLQGSSDGYLCSHASPSKQPSHVVKFEEIHSHFVCLLKQDDGKDCQYCTSKGEGFWNRLNQHLLQWHKNPPPDSDPNRCPFCGQWNRNATNLICRLTTPQGNKCSGQLGQPCVACGTVVRAQQLSCGACGCPTLPSGLSEVDATRLRSRVSAEVLKFEHFSRACEDIRDLCSFTRPPGRGPGDVTTQHFIFPVTLIPPAACHQLVQPRPQLWSAKSPWMHHLPFALIYLTLWFSGFPPESVESSEWEFRSNSQCQHSYAHQRAIYFEAGHTTAVVGVNHKQMWHQRPEACSPPSDESARVREIVSGLSQALPDVLEQMSLGCHRLPQTLSPLSTLGPTKVVTVDLGLDAPHMWWDRPTYRSISRQERTPVVEVLNSILEALLPSLHTLRMLLSDLAPLRTLGENMVPVLPQHLFAINDPRDVPTFMVTALILHVLTIQLLPRDHLIGAAPSLAAILTFVVQLFHPLLCAWKQLRDASSDAHHSFFCLRFAKDVNLFLLALIQKDQPSAARIPMRQLLVFLLALDAAKADGDQPERRRQTLEQSKSECHPRSIVIPCLCQQPQAMEVPIALDSPTRPQ